MINHRLPVGYVDATGEVMNVGFTSHLQLGVLSLLL